MRLSAKAIQTYNGPNSFSTGNQWTVRAGDPNTLYFQLIDLDQAGLRYLAGVGSSNQPFGVQVTFLSIDDTKKIIAQAVQADANDSSLWKVTLSSLQVPGGGNVWMAVQEGNAIRRFSVLGMLAVEYLNNGNA
jgi:hypothetical protein